MDATDTTMRYNPHAAAKNICRQVENIADSDYISAADRITFLTLVVAGIRLISNAIELARASA